MYLLHNLWYLLITKKRRNKASRKKKDAKKKNRLQKLFFLLECITKIANLIDKLLDFFRDFFQ